MSRWSRTEELLGLALTLRAPEACDAATREADGAADGWFRAVAAYAAFIHGDYRRAAELADTAIEEAADDTTRAAALAVRGLAAAGWWPGALDGWDAASPHGDATRRGAALLEGLPPGREADFARYLVGEGALACGRLLLAETTIDGMSDRLAPGAAGTIAEVLRSRILAFRGRIVEADAAVRRLESRAHDSPLDLVVAGTAALVRGNAAERATVRAYADRVEGSDLPPSDYLSRGCRLLAAFGLIAVGDVERSARLILTAGGDERLEAFTIVDRALGLELLVAMAAEAGDLDAAEAWRDRAASLRGHPIGGSTAARVDSRVLLLAGDAAGALAAAEDAVARALTEGRAVEAAEGEIVASRARAASQPGAAATRLATVVAEADLTGHRAVRMSAARELRSRGRRLRPIAGSGWDGLSARERDIAVLLAAGLSNREIAADRHLSEHTVRAHVSRILAAFGVASRIGVAAALALPADQVEPAELTVRQREVARLVAAGAGNSEIARTLGVGVGSVERHVHDILRRWNLTSRVGIARMLARSE